MEDMEALDDEFSSPEEISEFDETFKKFREIYLNVSTMITKGTELETRSENEVSKEVKDQRSLCKVDSLMRFAQLNYGNLIKISIFSTVACHLQKCN